MNIDINKLLKEIDSLKEALANGCGEVETPCINLLRTNLAIRDKLIDQMLIERFEK